MTLNKKLPYGIITGKPADGARFKQNGKRYLPDGTPVGGASTAPPVDAAPKAPAAAAAVVEEPAVPPAPALKAVPDAPVEEETPQASTNEDGSTDYENMHHMVLKKAVKDLGGEYIDRDSAIEFLKANEG